MKINMPKALRVLLVLLCVSASLRLDVPAQIKPVYDQGALGLGRLLKRLNTSASAMMIGAHPDDEDTALLSYLARGENARTAYLSLTRGDGGQNIIGPELGEALGVIRTEELLQARKLDGAEQYFTRAYDYGFSKTLEEAKQKWDEKVILCDVVRAIRDFRPLVVISQFIGTPADGHGQHQFSGHITPLAVKAAADSTQCANDGPAWEVKKFYVRHGFRASGEPTLRINTGKYDPLLGRSYFEIAMEARSQHKSQEQGVLELKGDQFSGLNLVGGDGKKESGIFDGIDTSTSWRREFSESLAEALNSYNPLKPDKVVAPLIEYHERTPYYGSGPSAAEVISGALGVRLDVLVDKETAAPGEKVQITANVFYPADADVKVLGLRSEGFSQLIEKNAPDAPLSSRREKASWSASFELTVPRGPLLEPTQPYWLKSRRRGEMFTVDYPRAIPFERPLLGVGVTLNIGGKSVILSKQAEYRYADDVRGEVRRNFNVVPKLSVEPDESLLIVPINSGTTSRELSVSVTNNSSGPVSGEVRLKNLPKSWKAESSSLSFDLKNKGEKTLVKFRLDIPPNTPAGSYDIRAEAIAEGESFVRTMSTIAYPHIQTHRIYSDAVMEVKIIDLRTPPIQIGYITGSGDRVAEAIERMGPEARAIDERTLASGDLSQFDVIVVGIRAYQVRTDIVAHNKRLLDFANAGGTLIVQYQLPGYTQQNLAPFPAQQGPRVADETAKVMMLDPKHPIFNVPNKITEADFQGWVQERNLYNFSTMDPKYIGLLESHDANEAENKGGLVVADIGKGKYIYCSYSLFRQLPAGVPGAYRLLANMLSYRGTNTGRKSK